MQACVILAYIAFLAIAGSILPGKTHAGTVLSDGSRRYYKCNGKSLVSSNFIGFDEVIGVSPAVLLEAPPWPVAFRYRKTADTILDHCCPEMLSPQRTFTKVSGIMPPSVQALHEMDSNGTIGG